MFDSEVYVRMEHETNDQHFMLFPAMKNERNIKVEINLDGFDNSSQTYTFKTILIKKWRIIISFFFAIRIYSISSLSISIYNNNYNNNNYNNNDYNDHNDKLYSGVVNII